MGKAFFGHTDLLSKSKEFIALNYKVSSTNELVCAWRDFNSTSCLLSTYCKGPDRTEKSSTFNFEHVNEVWIIAVLGVNAYSSFTNLDTIVTNSPEMEMK